MLEADFKDDDSDNEIDLQGDKSEKITKIMQSFMGYVYDFRKDKYELEKFYNKQMRIKYRGKTKKSLFLITLLVFLQEILLWIGFQLGE